jgi:hypothetical protein
MAERTTTVYDAQVDTRVNTARLPATQGRIVKFTRIAYSLVAGDETEADTIAICTLPPGAIPRPELSKVACSADPGTALVIDIGTAEDADGWADGMTLSSGGVVECCAPVVPAWMVRTELAADSGKKYTKVYATIATGTTLTVGVILYFILAWEDQG